MNFSGYISENNTEKEKSKLLAQNISNGFGDKNVRIKNANFHILKNVNHPIALVELGFLSNKNDREKLTSEEGQTELANSILEVLNSY